MSCLLSIQSLLPYPPFYCSKLLLISLWALIMLMLLSFNGLQWSVWMGYNIVCQISIFGPKKCVKNRNTIRTNCMKDRVSREQSVLRQSFQMKKYSEYKIIKGQVIYQTKCPEDKASRGQSVKRIKT